MNQYSARSEREISPQDISRSESPKAQAQSETSGKVILPDRQQLESDKENKEQKAYVDVKLGLNEKVKSAGSQNMKLSARSIQVEPSLVMKAGSQIQDHKTLSNLSFMQDSYLGGLSKRNRSMIDKFNKVKEKLYIKTYSV